ncbi:hypothetical protein DL766_004096 [Monosporascus sp. MC13-8B]|uniref:Nucleoside phosphorylase domain-containing protein n=1 Tax=Monosporascus cannonballus TaxID=155416 RepID=A0ABY0HML2_9PEZI|nr:hypothetical protein DL762_000789 [Monosporascus cannonballus]RYO96392.1 hypothetical protein DL763_003248 [Monosporascus cannonballus]RYP32089.1 hypothetical protein DL766_004096 [Monosporascus sp. MC13-8B]
MAITTNRHGSRTIAYCQVEPPFLRCAPSTSTQGPQHFGHDSQGYGFRYSTGSGRRKALLIGINYLGQRGQLRGSINDVRNMSAHLVQNFSYKRENMVILTDDQHNPMSEPTKQNILRAMHWLVKDAKPNDSLFFHYSGHGGQTKGLDGDELDGYDEVIYPVDFRQVGHITDDEMRRIMVRPLQAGVRLTAIFDSSHSGTALDLPYIYSTQGVLKQPNLAKEAGQGLLGVISSYQRGDLSGVAGNIMGGFNKATIGEDADNRAHAIKTSSADVITLSRTKDDQASGIAGSFRDKYVQQVESLPDRLTTNSDNMPLEDRMSLWFEKQDFEGIRLEEVLIDKYLETEDLRAPGCETSLQGFNRALSDGDSSYRDSSESDQEDIQETNNPRLLAYRDFIFNTEAYEWLLTRLRREFRLAPTKPNVMETIRQRITHSLPSTHRVSRKTPSEVYKTMFELDWDPLSFLEKQQYEAEPLDAVERVITLTGSCQDAQALTCAQYMSQTWPLMGELTMQLVKDVLGSGPGDQHTCDLSDGTKLVGWISGPKFMIVACGVAASIAEIGEQLAWLGAALRTSHRQKGLVYCTPFISDIRRNDALPQVSELPSLPGTVYKIDFTTEEVQQLASPSNGRCWHNMFMNPVIVKGYPIPPRTESGTGIEIPLNIMAGLARAQRVDRFNGDIFIKGFSTMLVPTKLSGDMLLWHLIYKEDGTRISYLDNTVTHAKHGRLDLENLRHVLGWCSEAKFYAGGSYSEIPKGTVADRCRFTGSAQAHHPVGHSGLPKPHEGCVLADISVSPGRLIIGGSPFALGAKDTPFHVTRSGYIPRLKWISTKFVLLWDEGDKRGWLINGTSALLHLVRASLGHDATDKFKSAFLFKNDDIQESSEPFKAESAVEVILDPRNTGLKIYPEKHGYILLEDRIEHFYNILEKLIDHQSDVAGANMSDKPRRYLEGWDFRDLATQRDSFYPRVATLQTRGKSWADFTRAIQAITLVGRGFGEIIKPADKGMCDYWTELPKRRYYLAACFSDLKQIMEVDDNHKSSPMRLSDDIIWHNPSTILGSCRCKGALGRDHSDPVQVLLPLAMSRILLPSRISFPLVDSGAVIFGQNSTFNWFWGDIGHPEEEESPSPSEASEDSVEDSGIGPSLVSSISEPKPISSRSTSRRLLRSPSDFPFDRTLSEPASSVDDDAPTRGQYTVGILCALPKELLAIRTLFDCKYESVETAFEDSNHYVLGRMGYHNVVAACLPSGEYGTNSAADAASHMKRSFRAIKFCLLVGIGGGVPSAENDVRLGDVVVSSPTGSLPGVIQYDIGKSLRNGIFESTGSLQRPPRFLMSAVSSLRSDPNLPLEPLKIYLEEIEKRRPDYRHPGQERDELFTAECMKCKAQEECANLDGHRHRRDRRPSDHPIIHYGLIASGNRIIKDAKERDRLARKHGILCFEMEAAGVMNTLPCLVIRGISDYADSHKNKIWQEYAAATAAAYAKLLLAYVKAADDFSDNVSPALRRKFSQSETLLAPNKRRRHEEDCNSRMSVTVTTARARARLSQQF